MNRIKELRIKKGLFQKDLASELQVAQNTLSYWEKGKFQPDNEMLQKIADFFNVSVDYILGRTDEPFSVNQQLSGLDFALYGETKDLTDEEKQDILDYVRYKKSKK